ncbi:MAG: hypothetical protein HQL11_06065 [Candidatus Omnitrophica bacterium]|nr:hypothetical protein [Candidatus Omnitrophota bacterium]
MIDEEHEIPEWEVHEEEVPPALEQKWEKARQRGLGAGVCRECGFPYTEEDLSCRHCGVPVEEPRLLPSTFSSWLLKTPVGLALFLAVVIAVAWVLVTLF